MTIELDGVNNTLKTDKIEPQSGTALQVGASGDTITVPSGATINIAGTISNSGTATGFGAIDYKVSSIKTSTFTAVAGEGYLVDTSSGAVTVNLPAGSAGAQVAIVDYAGTFQTNNVTIAANGSEKIQGSTDDGFLSRKGEAVNILYVDSTKGWVVTSTADQQLTQTTYHSASGGTETTSGDYKIHTFTSSGTFTVSSVGNAEDGGVSYLVVAGGGGGGAPQAGNRGGGAGAGGYREGKPSEDPYTASPTAATSQLPISVQAYPITIGAGASGGAGQPTTSNPGQIGSNGSSSIFSTITSAGGGGGGGGSPPGNGTIFPGQPGANGGGGGGGGTGPGTCARGGGSGNTPPVSPAQGTKGGAGGIHPGNPGAPDQGGGGGGGVTGPRGNPSGPSAEGGKGADGGTTEISGSSVAYGGGGGADGPNGNCYPGGSAPAGGVAANTDGTANRGSGAGGGAANGAGGDGGSGIVIIRYKFQN